MWKESEGVLGTAKVKVILSETDDDVVRAKHGEAECEGRLRALLGHLKSGPWNLDSLQ